MKSDGLIIGAAFITLLGTIGGAAGASSTFWTDKGEAKVRRAAGAVAGERRYAKRAAALRSLSYREWWRDRFTAFGWGAILVGAAAAFCGALIA